MAEDKKKWTDLSTQNKALWAIKKVEQDLTLGDGSIVVPEGYNLPMAMKFLEIHLPELVDKNKRPALEVCTRNSVMNAIAKMVADGTYLHKNQCYFIVRGNSLCYVRSYHGHQMKVKSLPGVGDVFYRVIREGDVFETHIENGQDVIDKHESKWDSEGKIIGAYCVIVGKDKEIIRTKIMTKAKIDQCWSHSKSVEKAIHKEFPEDMCGRTVVTHACKRFADTYPQLAIPENLYQEEESETIDGEIIQDDKPALGLIEFDETDDQAIPAEPEEPGNPEPTQSKPKQQAKIAHPKDPDDECPF